MIQIENLYDENRAEKETLVNTNYTGNHKALAGTSGTCYYKNNVWFYTPSGEDEEYRVDGKNLDCNTQEGWIKCTYSGENKQAGTEGKAYFDIIENVWMFKPKGSKELYRMGKSGGNLKFYRA
jgi:hypothetical protein